MNFRRVIIVSLLSSFLSASIFAGDEPTTAPEGYSKKTCTLMLGTIGAYSALGVWAIYSAYQKYGSAFVSESALNIWNDPIYLYAAADLGAIFTIASIYTVQDARKRGLKAWPWIPAYFVFGTPAFLTYLLRASKYPRQSE